MSNERYFPLFANLLPFRFSIGKVKQGGNWAAQKILNLETRCIIHLGKKPSQRVIIANIDNNLLSTAEFLSAIIDRLMLIIKYTI